MGIGTPIDPTRPERSKGLMCVTGAASVSPDPSTRRPRVSFSKASCTSMGRGAAPLTQALMEDSPYERTPGAWLIAIYMDGTPGKMVGL